MGVQGCLFIMSQSLLVIIFVTVKSGCSYSSSDGWTSLLEASSGHRRPYSGDRLQSYFTDTEEDEENQVHGGWTSLSQASQDFSRYFNEDDSYPLHGYNRSGEDEDRQGKQFGLSLLPLLSAGYYSPGQLFPLTNNPGLSQRRPTKPPTTTTTTARPQTVEWTLDWDQITSRPSRRPRPQEDNYGLENEDNYIDDLFDNGIDFDDYDEDNIEENLTFSELPISTVTPADIEGRVRSLEEIFTSLHVSSEGCQKMLVCHLSKDQEEFSPLSHLVLDLLELDTAQVQRGSVELDDTVRYLDLLQAAESGHHRMCYKYSSKCDYKGEDMINEDGLRAWKLMYKVLTMKTLAVRNGKQF